MIRLLTIVVLLVTSLSISFATIIKVPQDQSTIQAGIDSALPGDTVLVAEDTYPENIYFKGKAITVASEFIMDGNTDHISGTIIDGSQASNPDSASVVYFISGEDTTSVLCGFTITGGRGTFKDYIFSIQGGGIYMLSGGKISYNRIIGNDITTDFGGGGAGIAVNLRYTDFTDFNVIINNNEIQFNSILSREHNAGGGINLDFRDCLGGYCRVNNNIISYNSLDVTKPWSHTTGGGIGISLSLPTSGDIIVDNNTITYNNSHNIRRFSMGGGICVVYYEPDEIFTDHNPSPYIYNNIIAHNYSADKGSGIAIWTRGYDYSKYSIISPQPAIINNTIVHNYFSDNGSGIFNFDSYPLLVNNILWNDLSPPGTREIFNEDTYYWIISTDKNNDGEVYLYNSLVQDIDWSNISRECYNLDPLLLNESYYLSQESPAIGAGKKSINVEEAIYLAPDYDFDGNRRPNPTDTLVDIGALESPHQPFLKVYPRSLNIDKSYVKNGTDSIQFTSQIFNPNGHDINVFGRINKINKTRIDSIKLFDDGNHGDGQAGDGLFGGFLDIGLLMGENEFNISMGIEDNEIEKYFIYGSPTSFTSVGPIRFAGYSIDYIFENFIAIKPLLRNEGNITTATGITVELTPNDENIVSVETFTQKYAHDIPASHTVKSNQLFTVELADSPDTLFFHVKIYSHGYHFWSDSSGIATSVAAKNHSIPKRFYLSQNYPNPFNPKTVISWQLAVGSDVDLSIFNVLGQKVATLVSGKQEAGLHTVEWDASRVASGVYYYRLEAGTFVDTKKLIVLK